MFRIAYRTQALFFSLCLVLQCPLGLFVFTIIGSDGTGSFSDDEDRFRISRLRIFNKNLYFIVKGQALRMQLDYQVLGYLIFFLKLRIEIFLELFYRSVLADKRLGSSSNGIPLGTYQKSNFVRIFRRVDRTMYSVQWIWCVCLCAWDHTSRHQDKMKYFSLFLVQIRLGVQSVCFSDMRENGREEYKCLFQYSKQKCKFGTTELINYRYYNTYNMSPGRISDWKFKLK